MKIGNFNLDKDVTLSLYIIVQLMANIMKIYKML